MVLTTLAKAKISEMKKRCTNLSDSLELAAIGITKWKTDSKKNVCTYPDGSKLTIVLEGFCYADNDIQEKFYFIDEENSDELKAVHNLHAGD